MSISSALRIERFYAKVRKRGDCWIWIGRKIWNGYGQYAKRERCERELFYEEMGLPPRNCITDDRTLCPVCEGEILKLPRPRKHSKGGKK